MKTSFPGVFLSPVPAELLSESPKLQLCVRLLSPSLGESSLLRVHGFPHFSVFQSVKPLFCKKEQDECFWIKGMSWCDVLERKYLFFWWSTRSWFYNVFLCAAPLVMFYGSFEGCNFIICNQVGFFWEFVWRRGFSHRHLRPNLQWGFRAGQHLWDSRISTGLCAGGDGNEILQSSLSDELEQLKAIAMTSSQGLFQSRKGVIGRLMAFSLSEFMWEMSSM